ncbi:MULTISPECIES: hypothetical protein [unclassified Enterococcus]|uniref:hypothetical protein n=2 Tax=unclassified Enterococcus TaxID=2608891 RepID=UPI000B717565|nr:hypothetical protein [Enterococcus sp. 3C7_DIV0644]OTO26615.1 hypothetical protein A5877_002157 [Enterococcus sp. 3C7_DIV0644]
MLHQNQVISSQINQLALAVLFGLAGYLLVFKKFYFLSAQIAEHSDQYNQAEVKWDKIAGVVAFYIALISLILVFV